MVDKVTMNIKYSVEDIRVSIMDYRNENDLSITAFSNLTKVARQTIHALMNWELAFLYPVTLDKLRKAGVIK